MPEEKTTNPRAAAQLTGRVTQETLAKFKEIQEAESFETFGQFVESLLMHYYDPVKVNKENEAEINRLKAKIKEKEADNAAACESINEEREKLANLQSAFDDLKQQFNAKCAENEELTNRLRDKEGQIRRYDGTIAVPVTKLEMRCLEWLSDRENRRRGSDDVTPSIFFQYAVSEMLIRGNKFSIDCVPNSVIAQFEKEIRNGQ